MKPRKFFQFYYGESPVDGLINDMSVAAFDSLEDTYAELRKEFATDRDFATILEVTVRPIKRARVGIEEVKLVTAPKRSKKKG